MEDRVVQQEPRGTPVSGGFMQYSEEDSVYDDLPYASYSRWTKEEEPAGSGKKRIFVMVLSLVLCVSILVSGLIYAMRRLPDVPGGTDEASATPVAASSSPDPAYTVTSRRSLTLERTLLVFRNHDEDGPKTRMEVAYDMILAPEGPAALTKVLAAENEKTDASFRNTLEVKRRLNDVADPDGGEAAVYRLEADIRIDRADEALVSFVRTERTIREPGAADFISYSAVNMDPVSGESVDAARIIKDRQALYDAVMSALRQDPGMDTVLSVRTELPEAIREAVMQDPVFTVDTEGLHIFLPSSLGKGLLGARDVWIPFEGNENVFLENAYTASAGDSVPMRLNRLPMKEEIYDLQSYLSEDTPAEEAPSEEAPAEEEDDRD